MIRENSSETCISASVKQMTSANSMHEAGHSKPVVWDDQRNGVAREVGGAFRMGASHIHPWLVHVKVWQNHHNNVKLTSLQLK